MSFPLCIIISTVPERLCQRKVIEDLQQRLGDGWVVEKMMHDSNRPPCELVATVGSVDVLLTAHGFQVP